MGTNGKGKMFFDPVAGFSRLSSYSVAVMDSPEFQRLRDLKQLGITYYVFPGACHNRFEHSLGTAELAFKVVSRLAAAQPELELEAEDIRAVELAGLCHDLGHGPFSHVFDNEFLPRTAAHQSDPEVREWSHEAMSGRMLERIVDGMCEADPAQSIVTRSDIARVMDMITGGKDAPGRVRPKRYLFDIVANGRNSIDVDKFDYLSRDCHYTGVKHSCDFQRLIHFQRVVGDEICYRYSEYTNIWDLFQTRASLHRIVYTHKKAKAIEFMLVDAMLEADDCLKIAERVKDPAAFLRLDDTILKQIEFTSDDVVAEYPRMRKARELVNRIRKRNIYGFLNECCVPEDRLATWTKDSCTAEAITACQKASGYHRLVPGDIIVQNYKVDFTMGSRNPLDHVRFWSTGTADEASFHMPTSTASTMLPRSFIERKVRVFTRSKDPHVVEAAAAAFEEWQRREFKGLRQTTETPLKRPRAVMMGPDGEMGSQPPSQTRTRFDDVAAAPRVSQLPPNMPSPVLEENMPGAGGLGEGEGEDPLLLFDMNAGAAQTGEGSITLNGGAGSAMNPPRSTAGAGNSKSGAGSGVHRSLNYPS